VDGEDECWVFMRSVPGNEVKVQGAGEGATCTALWYINATGVKEAESLAGEVRLDGHKDEGGRGGRQCTCTWNGCWPAPCTFCQNWPMLPDCCRLFEVKGELGRLLLLFCIFSASACALSDPAARGSTRRWPERHAPAPPTPVRRQPAEMRGHRYARNVASFRYGSAWSRLRLENTAPTHAPRPRSKHRSSRPRGRLVRALSLLVEPCLRGRRELCVGAMPWYTPITSRSKKSDRKSKKSRVPMCWLMDAKWGVSSVRHPILRPTKRRDDISQLPVQKRRRVTLLSCFRSLLFSG